ncbi:MAG: non-hydrolyzing UDP-N-acetylglucosamine 2-epimerase, partial [Candidatus Promineifilaceae bacterium]
IVADHVSDLHFAPTATAKDNLLREGFGQESIFVTGNTGVDALLAVSQSPVLQKFPIPDFPESRDLILVTAHRRENHGKPLRQICDALRQLALRRDVHIVYPVHKNPNIWNPVHAMLGDHQNLTLLPPVSYPTMINLIVRSKLILTDSGGIQEEAPTFGKPVLVLRAVTERPEAVAAGAARVIGSETEVILKQVNTLLDNSQEYDKMAQARNPFGDGHASWRIARILAAGGTRPADVDDWT